LRAEGKKHVVTSGALQQRKNKKIMRKRLQHISKTFTGTDCLT